MALVPWYYLYKGMIFHDIASNDTILTTISLFSVLEGAGNCPRKAEDTEGEGALLQTGAV